MDKSFRRERLSSGRASPWWPRIIALFVCWRGRAKERRLLAALDERELTDIGITRLDALRECAKPFWQA
jgi:uncharacterized protein YjiS (DUF1127 family)